MRRWLLIRRSSEDPDDLGQEQTNGSPVTATRITRPSGPQIVFMPLSLYLYRMRLAETLGHPDRDPHGDPIPQADGVLAQEDSRPLSEATVGDRVHILRVGHEDVPTLTYLGERGLVPGRLLTVEEVRTLDGVVTVEGEDGTSHALGGHWRLRFWFKTFRGRLHGVQEAAHILLMRL